MSAEAVREEAKTHYVNGRYAQAVEVYTRLIDVADSSDTELHVYYSNRSACYLQMNNAALARDDAESCTRLKPNWAKGHDRLGKCLVRLNRPREAVFAFERAVALEPHNREIQQNLQDARNRGGGGGGGGGFGGGGGGGGMAGMRTMLGDYAARAMQWWAHTNENTKMAIVAGVVLLFAYMFFSRPSSHSYYGGYDGGYYTGGGGGGLSWMSFGAIMMAAWKLPPLFPQQLGHYAQPFFGMSWTTFMMLLNMFSSQRRSFSPFGQGGMRRRGWF